MYIKIAEDFSPYPAGRTSVDGKYSGEKFREEYLKPAIKTALENKKKLEISLDGVRVFGSSFLEEAFGGLVRNGYFSKEDIMSILVINTNKIAMEIYKEAIKKYINEAIVKS